MNKNVWITEIGIARISDANVITASDDSLSPFFTTVNALPPDLP